MCDKSACIAKALWVLYNYHSGTQHSAGNDHIFDEGSPKPRDCHIEEDCQTEGDKRVRQKEEEDCRYGRCLYVKG